MAVDIFNPRSMTKQLVQRKQPRSFLRDTFFGTVETHATPFVDIHIVKGKRRLAPYVHPDSAGKVVERIGASGETFSPPYIKPKMVTTANDLLKALPGEVIYMDDRGNSPQERAATILAEDMATMDDMIIRREELQAAQALFGGVVAIKGEGIDTSIDFGIPAGNIITLSGAALWSASTSDPIADLRTWKRQIAQVSGMNADIVVLGADVVNAFVNNVNVQKLLDVRRFELGIVKPEDKGNGVTFVADIISLGMEIWAYDEWYIDDQTQVETPMIPAKKVLVTSKNAMRKRHYRSIHDISAGTFASPRFAKSWMKEDPSARYVMVQSGPLCVPHQVDAIINATVLV